MSSDSLPTVANVTPPSSAILSHVLTYVKQHVSISTYNHSHRSVYFMLLLTSKLPPMQAATASGAINLETAMLALLMHDLGWATTKSLLSKDKRFEVDGANLAVKFIQDSIQAGHTTSAVWDKHRQEELWSAIALHTSGSLAIPHINPTMALIHLSIAGDFFGPNLPPPLPAGLITEDEYKAIVRAYPREGFAEELVGIMCGLCREKKETTFDNFVGEFGVEFGLDGKGEGKEAFKKEKEEMNFCKLLMRGLEGCGEIEKGL